MSKGEIPRSWRKKKKLSKWGLKRSRKKQNRRSCTKLRKPRNRLKLIRLYHFAEVKHTAMMKTMFLRVGQKEVELTCPSLDKHTCSWVWRRILKVRCMKEGRGRNSWRYKDNLRNSRERLKNHQHRRKRQVEVWPYKSYTRKRRRTSRKLKLPKCVILNVQWLELIKQVDKNRISYSRLSLGTLHLWRQGQRVPMAASTTRSYLQRGDHLVT